MCVRNFKSIRLVEWETWPVKKKKKSNNSTLVLWTSVVYGRGHQTFWTWEQHLWDLLMWKVPDSIEHFWNNKFAEITLNLLYINNYILFMCVCVCVKTLIMFRNSHNKYQQWFIVVESGCSKYQHAIICINRCKSSHFQMIMSPTSFFSFLEQARGLLM